MDVVFASLFALVAGAGTAVSPCVLPVLPLAVSGAATGGRRRPLGIALGLAASFAFATLALAYVIAALGLPDDLLRTVAIVVLLVFGVTLIVPALSARLEGWLSRVVPARAAARGGDGFGSGLVLGASLGLLYVPCAGPVLAAVLTVQASQELSAQRLVTGLAYAVGTAVAVLAVLLLGRRALSRVRASAGRLQQALGVVMVVVAVLTLTGVDGRFRTAVADSLPGWLVSPTAGIEKQGVREAPSGLVDGGPAPELAGTQEWFNTDPLTLRGLRGRVVLIDFWTYTCINCIRTFPYLRAWDDRYRDDGLTIIGVHAPEFAFERDAGNVERAVRENGLRYPVVQDNDFAVWQSFGNQYWPAKYLIDRRGNVRYAHFGEGGYEETERAIRTLLDTRGAGVGDVDAPVGDPAVRTPETYLGHERAEGFARIEPGSSSYVPPTRLRLNEFAFGGRWDVEAERATAGRDATLSARVRARRVFLVMRGRGNVRVSVDGERHRVVRVRDDDIYTLVDLPSARSFRLDLAVDEGVSGYAFTFG